MNQAVQQRAFYTSYQHIPDHCRPSLSIVRFVDEILARGVCKRYLKASVTISTMNTWRIFRLYLGDNASAQER